MFGHSADSLTVRALSNSSSIIEISPDGTILSANENALALFGYTLSELVGKPHAILLLPQEREHEKHAAFWNDLRHGKSFSSQYRRLEKGGREIWTNSSYVPVQKGRKVVRIVEISTDVTADRLVRSRMETKLIAVERSQAVIEFALDGTIVYANQNFLSVVGYSLDEIRGKHHKILVDPVDAAGPRYAGLWEQLRAGAFDVGEYKCIGKNGRVIWIHASYNPLKDAIGNVMGVVKFATDISTEKEARMRRANAQVVVNEGVHIFKSGIK